MAKQSGYAYAADVHNGATGPQGTAGVQSSSSEVYYSVAQASAPSAPTATAYNFSTGVFTGLTTNWSKDATTLAASQTDFYWQCTYVVTEATAGGTQTITFGTITKVASFSNLVVTGGAAADVNAGTTRISGSALDIGSVTVGDTDTTTAGTQYGVTAGVGVHMDSSGNFAVGNQTSYLSFDGTDFRVNARTTPLFWNNSTSYNLGELVRYSSSIVPEVWTVTFSAGVSATSSQSEWGSRTIRLSIGGVVILNDRRVQPSDFTVSGTTLISNIAAYINSNLPDWTASVVGLVMTMTLSSGGTNTTPTAGVAVSRFGLLSGTGVGVLTTDGSSGTDAFYLSQAESTNQTPGPSSDYWLQIGGPRSFLFTNTGASETWKVPPGITRIYITACAGGGGGGRHSTSTAGGGGGGGGTSVIRAPATAVSGNTLTITVGSGGGNGATAGSDGSDGGATVISGTLNGTNGNITLTAGLGGTTSGAGKGGANGSSTSGIDIPSNVGSQGGYSSSGTVFRGGAAAAQNTTLNTVDGSSVGALYLYSFSGPFGRALIDSVEGYGQGGTGNNSLNVAFAGTQGFVLIELE